MTRREAVSAFFQHGELESKPIADRIAVSLLRCAIAGIVISILVYRTGGYAEEHPSAYLFTAVYLLYSAAYVFHATIARHGLNEKFYLLIDMLLLAGVLVTMRLHDSPFFTLLVFPTVVASRLAGSKEGRLVNLACALLYIATAYPLLANHGMSSFDVGNRALCLFVLGTVIVYLAASEEVVRKKLKFLQDVNTAWNPRLGMDRTVTNNLKRLGQLYEADSAILVLRSALVDTGWKLYLTDRDGQSKVSEITSDTAEDLMQLPSTMSTAYTTSKRLKLRAPTYYYRSGRRRSARRAIDAKCEALANILDTTSFATVPYAQQDGTVGRLYITSVKKAFARPDVSFLIHVSTVMSIVQEDMYLTEHLLSKAADYERQQISRDMHDTTIQPYIGLKLALDALLREAKNTPLAARIEDITHMTAMTISNLRTYTSQLRENTSMPGESLISAVSKQAEVYLRFYGIKVDINTKINAPVNGRLAAELLQIISEGLSNVLRHTDSKHACISIRSTPAEITLEIANRNEKNSHERKSFFSPRSISERAAALGGRVIVREAVHGYTCVIVKTPNLAEV